jgi:hypothetical protein
VRTRIALAVIAAALCITGVARAESAVLLGSAQTSWTNTSVGGGVSYYQSVEAWQQTATATASTLTANFYFTTHPQTQAVGVYSDNNGVPGTLLGSATLPAGTGWKVATFTGVSLTSGTAYWIAQLQLGGQPGSGYSNTYPVDELCGSPNNSTPVTAAWLTGQTALPASWPAGGTTGTDCLHGFVIKG